MQTQQAHSDPQSKDGFYFHPRPDQRTTNTYVLAFYHALQQRVRIVNTGNSPESRSGELMRHVLQTKVLVLNWPEDIIYLRKGFLQALLFNLCTLLVKLRGGKVIWICHNRKTHHKGKALLSRWNRSFFRWAADTIVVHAGEALKLFGDVAHKTVFLPHPRYNRPAQRTSAGGTGASVLIWGSITPYKGLDGFIEAYKQRSAQFSVLIRGKANAGYFNQLATAAQGTNVKLRNGLLTDADLEQEFANCKIILLPYTESDTFSSGALIHSLNAGKIVIGPRVGNFIDLAAAGACLTYANHDELFVLIDRLLTHEEHYQQCLAKLQEGIEQYYQTHSWEAFVADLLRLSGTEQPTYTEQSAATGTGKSHLIHTLQPHKYES